MGQLQRDGRRSARQETIELWEMETERTRSPRQRQRSQPRPVREGQQRRTQWEGESRQGRSRQEREFPQERRERQTRESRQERPSRQGREIEQIGQSRAGRESGQRRQTGHPRQGREIEQIGQSRMARESGQRRPSRQARPQRSRSNTYGQEEDLQFVLPVEYPQAGNPRPVQSMKRRRARRRKEIFSKVVVFLFVVLCLALIYQATGAVYRYIHRDWTSETVQKDEGIISTLSDKLNGKKIVPPEILEDYLDVNEYSRPGTKLRKVKSVFVHYTANPGTSAQQNRSYFANLAETHERSASAHFIIGYEGELVQCIPLDEQAYAVATRNEDSVSIECCYLAQDGSFTPETYETLLHTLAWLLEEYDLNTEDILRHYDCGGKKCPLYYVENEGAWEQLLADVESYETPTE